MKKQKSKEEIISLKEENKFLFVALTGFIVLCFLFLFGLIETQNSLSEVNKAYSLLGDTNSYYLKSSADFNTTRIILPKEKEDSNNYDCNGLGGFNAGSGYCIKGDSIHIEQTESEPKIESDLNKWLETEVDFDDCITGTVFDLTTGKVICHELLCGKEEQTYKKPATYSDCPESEPEKQGDD